MSNGYVKPDEEAISILASEETKMVSVGVLPGLAEALAATHTNETVKTAVTTHPDLAERELGTVIPPQPETVITEADIGVWYEMAVKLKKLKMQESLERKRIFGHFFTDPDEGTNNHDLADGYVLKGKHTLTREVDEGAYTSLKEKFREKGFNPDVLVKWKPTLVKKEYNKLSDENRTYFDQILLIKPGSPALEVVLPKKKGTVA